MTDMYKVCVHIHLACMTSIYRFKYNEQIKTVLYSNCTHTHIMDGKEFGVFSAI